MWTCHRTIIDLCPITLLKSVHRFTFLFASLVSWSFPYCISLLRVASSNSTKVNNHQITLRIINGTYFNVRVSDAKHSIGAMKWEWQLPNPALSLSRHEHHDPVTRFHVNSLGRPVIVGLLGNLSLLNVSPCRFPSSREDGAQIYCVIVSIA